MIWDDGQNTCGNPVPIVDDKGRIHLLMTWNYQTDKWGTITNGTGENTRRPYYTYSDDDGVTWASPVEITSAVKKKNGIGTLLDLVMVFKFRKGPIGDV